MYIDYIEVEAQGIASKNRAARFSVFHTNNAEVETQGIASLLNFSQIGCILQKNLYK
jgi:hypothetical protein